MNEKMGYLYPKIWIWKVAYKRVKYEIKEQEQLGDGRLKEGKECEWIWINLNYIINLRENFKNLRKVIIRRWKVNSILLNVKRTTNMWMTKLPLIQD